MSLPYILAFALIVSIHSRLCFELASRIFQKSKYHFLQYLFCILNALVVVLILQLLSEFSSFHYFLLVVLLLSQIWILFKSAFIAILTVTLGLILHLFVFRAIIISIFALTSSLNILTIVTDAYFFWLTGLLSFVVHNIAIILFNKFVSAKYLQIIEKNTELLTYMSLLCVLFVSYLIYNANIYSLDSMIKGIEVQQIILPTLILILFYVALLMLFYIINLHDYKKKATELEDTISKEFLLKSALFSLSKVFVEFNCTKDEVNRLVIYGIDADTSDYTSYTDFHTKTSKLFMHPDDINIGLKILPQNIIELHSQGISKIVYEYRTPHSDLDYRWHKLLMQSKIDEDTNDVTAFFVISEIHAEKESHLALKDKSERDPLTGGLNKEASMMYVDNHLQIHTHGTFFMIDLDNFKAINDNFGHAYGDDVLCNVYKTIKQHFRSHDFIARIGGDEFVAFTTDTLDQKVLIEKAQSLCDDIKHTYSNNTGIDITVSASIGITQAPNDGITYSELFEKADQAMYKSKNKGKNMFTFYSNTK